MRKRLSYQSPNVALIISEADDIVTLSGIIDNDGDFRDWEEGKPDWD